MRIDSVSVSGLLGQSDAVKYQFNSDLNLLTGRNGSGKTTILKLIWLIISGNVLIALKEVPFRSCTIVTSEYSCTVIRTGRVNCKIEMEIGGLTYSFEDDSEELGEFGEAAEDKAASHLTVGSSLFFPTFRRIEGGFSMTPAQRNRSGNFFRTEADIDEPLAALSRKLTEKDHIFVSAISTQDIVSLLLKKYAIFSEEINGFQGNVSRSVINKIRQYENTQGGGQNADQLLSETRAEIEKIEEFRSETMQPLDAIRSLVERLFRHSGISFGKRLSFGDAAEAVNSEALSAGEKQMLSFICYNAFYKDAVVFIDEPELSLHVDWQRQLYSILESQNSGNQFIFATHSPFIYAKYPDKEVLVGSDRGDLHV
ncbi:AAA family ATPase [Xanthomonas campestris pv. incanae]|nr:ATP-binding protein [Xanthomonas campestris pv. incanae]WDJ12045.1 AAA family ATPase [Xanthomonas campestris pv. incanae]